MNSQQNRGDSNLILSQVRDDFSRSCEKYFVCYSMASLGVKRGYESLRSLNANPHNTLFVGKEHPDAGKPDASINIGEYLNSYESGDFQELIARSLVTAIYTEWEEIRRAQLAEDLGVSRDTVRCDLMGDVREIRHLIVHKVWRGKEFKELSWIVDPSTFRITHEMFSELIGKIKQMAIRLD